MKELLQQLAGYNTWANKVMINKLCALEPAVIDMAVTSSFQSLRSTVYHCWSAEDIWLQRLMATPDPIWAEAIFKGSFEDACSNWQVISTGLEHFVANHTDDSLLATAQYKDLKGNEFTTPANEILLHVFNHATYHRGQLITILRKLGETAVPRTDFIVYSREVLHAKK